MKKSILLVFGCVLSIFAQNNNPNKGYWQQKVDYKMDVKMDVKNFTYQGKQILTYTNNSSDTLKNVYFHLYYNAFQPGSEMDARLSSIKDPDFRMVNKKVHGDLVEKISKIKTFTPQEIGYLKIENLKQNGIDIASKVSGTILEVELKEPILPGKSTLFTLDFKGQVPAMVRRAGRNSAENVALSMSQWYPKMAEFDFEGWHTDPYIGREFHGVWGDFDVKLTLDKNYVVGASGYLQNKNEIGHGYEDKGVKVKHPKDLKELTWHFIAPNVHDFAWGADPDYAHDKLIGQNNVELHFFYKKNDKQVVKNWKKMEPIASEFLSFYNKHVGLYPYKQYSIIQGGDGGMEYAMCTLITGKRSMESLLGVVAHEFAHMWFQHMLATNESKHGWMDEGFTSFISDYAMHQVVHKGENSAEHPFIEGYQTYFKLVKTGQEQPLTTHADRFDTNKSYSISSYVKGSIFLSQLAYVIGWDNLFKTLQKYYSEFRFSHPTPNDFKRTAERVTGAVLDWYLVDWTQTVNTVDYAIKSVKESKNQTTIVLERIGRMPMPIELLVVYEDDSQEVLYIPSSLMRWEKPSEYPYVKWSVHKPWDWGNPDYEIKMDTKDKKIKKLLIDPSILMADVQPENNLYQN